MSFPRRNEGRPSGLRLREDMEPMAPGTRPGPMRVLASTDSVMIAPHHLLSALGLIRHVAEVELRRRASNSDSSSLEEQPVPELFDEELSQEESSEGVDDPYSGGETSDTEEADESSTEEERTPQSAATVETLRLLESILQGFSPNSEEPEVPDSQYGSNQPTESRGSRAVRTSGPTLAEYMDSLVDEDSSEDYCPLTKVQYTSRELRNQERLLNGLRQLEERYSVGR
jgi:hypothetical protein